MEQFTHEQAIAFVNETGHKYPSLELKVHLDREENLFIGIYHNGNRIATSEAQFGNFITACQLVALDVEIARMVSISSGAEA